MKSKGEKERRRVEKREGETGKKTGSTGGWRRGSGTRGEERERERERERG